MLSISYSDIQGDSVFVTEGNLTWDNGNIDVDPLFVDADNGNYHLLATSQLINAGHPDSTDSDGTIADIGAYPYLNSYNGPNWYITESGNDTTATGASDDPFRSIQAGINFSSDADSVAVAAGTYVENITFRGRNIKVVGADRETTIIDGGADTTFNDASGVVVFNSGETSAALLDGFTIQNGTSFRGGGLTITASPTIKNLIIKNNSALSGGGVHIQTGDPIFNNVDFLNNVSTVDYDGYSLGANGGALSVTGESQSIFSRCTFAGNQSGGYGGGAYVETATPNFINVNFYGNNSANEEGDGLVLSAGSTVDVTNSIFWSNNPEQIKFKSGGDANSLTVAYSNIQGGQDSIVTNDNGTVTWGSGNIDVDPMFVDTANGNYHLRASSQLINGGHPDSTDSDGTIADIGAYPYLNSYSGPTWYITESGNDTTATGASDDPFRSIQAGINFSNSGDTVLVAAGQYTENINWRNVNGIKLIGSGVENCIIDGGQISNVITIGNSNMGSGLIDTSTVISSFTIRNGESLSGGPFGQGGGLHINHQSSPLLENLLITDNTGGHGGGMFVTNGSSPLIRNVVIKDNIGSEGGGIAFMAGGSPKLENVLIHNNTAGSFGGGIYCGAQHMSLTNVTITENSSNAVGGSIYFAYQNFDDSDERPIITNSIFWDNSPQEFYLASDPGTYVMGNFEIQYSDVTGGLDSVNIDGESTITWGNGNIDVDPMFVDTANGDYHLLADSRLIDAGHPDSTDVDGTIADMGAYYYDQAGQPVRVSNLITTPAADNVSVKWNANSAAASYNIYRSTDGSADFYSLSPYTTESDTLYVDETAANNTTYHYRVSAVDGESDEGILAFPAHGRTGPDSTALYAPDVNLSRTLTTDLDAGTNLTLEGFFRFLETPAEERKFIFLGWEVSVATFPDEAGTLLRLIHNENSYDGIVIGDTSWHHLALATDGSTTTLWVDGYAAAQSTAGFSINDLILQLGNGGASAQTIEMDEVRLSNVARYSAGFIPMALTDDENTLGYWRFNEGSFDADVPTVYDLSGSGLHLELAGPGQAAWNPDAPVRTDTENAIVINEIMPNPSGSDGGKEWIELYNQWFTPLYLQGWSISGGGGGETVTLSDNVAIPPGGYALLAQSSDTTSNGGIDPQIEYGSGISLSNAGETISIKDGGGAVVDSVTYTADFPFASGASMELIVPQWDNNDTLSWVTAGIPYGDGVNLGSPGRKNDAYSGVVDVSIDTINFSYVTEGEEQSASFFIGNNGVADLHVSQVSTGTEVFSVDPEQAGIAAGDLVQIDIFFNPPLVGDYVDTVYIISNDPYTPLVTVVLSGSGINEFPDISVTDGITDSISVLNFPFTRVNETWTDSIYVVNLGAPDLEIEEIFLEGDAEFSTPGEAGLIAFMDTLVVPITFSPSATGVYTANLVLGSSDPDESSYTVVLTG
ncbi:MAG: lamin tail domain-containing protein, partial [Candidatus Marinimicrobia bacterium]|nr:lamin tail domain-containing protein [Candidatus Neomarinimicrobiota bacterium]